MRKTKQPYTPAKKSPSEIRYNMYKSEVFAEDPKHRITKDGKGGIKVMGNLSPELRGKLESDL